MNKLHFAEDKETTILVEKPIGLVSFREELFPSNSKFKNRKHTKVRYILYISRTSLVLLELFNE